MFNTLVFLISQMKLIKRTEKLEVDVNIEMGRTVLSTISISRVDYKTNHLINSMLKKTGQRSSHPILLSRLS